MKDEYSKNELSVEEWLKKAYYDELYAISLLKHRDAPANGVCFATQQMAEKLLKTYLVYKQKSFPKIHHLDILLEMCCENDPSLIEVKQDAIFLSEFYITTRYPGDFPEFSWQEAEKAFDAATRIKECILNKIPFDIDYDQWYKK